MKKSALFAGLLLTACGGVGSAKFTTWGESYIEEELPSSVFEDGWSIRFTKYLVVIGEIKVVDRSGKVVATQAAPRVFDMTRKGPVEVESFSEVNAQRYEQVSFAIAPSAQATAGTADAADVAAIKSSGQSIYFEGVATKGQVTKQLKWGFATNTLYDDCIAEGFGPGLTVPAGGVETVQLTIHGDHMFYDDLQSPEAKVRFDPIAAADGPMGDGVVTLEELQAVDFSDLPIDQYGGGSREKNLRDFVTSLSRTIGHYRGEGECTAHAR